MSSARADKQPAVGRGELGVVRAPREDVQGFQEGSALGEGLFDLGGEFRGERVKALAGIAANSPAAVVTRASAMPGATARRLAEPEVPRPEKASIMPQTVPNRPMKGVTLAVV